MAHRRSLPEALLQGLDPALERSHPALQVFPPGLLIRQQSLDPAEAFEDRLVLLLQSFQAPIEVV